MWRLGEKAKSRLAVGAKVGALFAAGFVGQKVSDAGEQASMSAFNEREEQKQRARYEAVKQEGGGIIPKAPTPSVSAGYSGVVTREPTQAYAVPWARSVVGRQEYLGQQQGSRPYFGGV